MRVQNFGCGHRSTLSILKDTIPCTKSIAVQLWIPHPEKLQSSRTSSDPMHCILSIQYRTKVFTWPKCPFAWSFWIHSHSNRSERSLWTFGLMIKYWFAINLTGQWLSTDPYVSLRSQNSHWYGWTWHFWERRGDRINLCFIRYPLQSDPVQSFAFIETLHHL